MTSFGAKGQKDLEKFLRRRSGPIRGENPPAPSPLKFSFVKGTIKKQSSLSI